MQLENKQIKRKDLLAKHGISTSMLWPLIQDGYIERHEGYYIELKPLDIVEYKRQRNLKRKQHLSEATKKYYQDETHRKEQSKRLSNYRNNMTEEQKQKEHDKFSILMKQVMSSSDVKAKISKGMKEMLSNPENCQKHIDTMQKYLQSKETCEKRAKSIQDFWANASEEFHKKHSEHIKLGQAQSGAIEKISQASKRFWQSEEYRQKQINTKLANGTHNGSAQEDYCYEQLCNVFKEVKRQYRTKEYPFLCDFYVPELDLYIEYNGYYTHQPGYGFYDETNPDHIANLNKLKELSETSVMYSKCIEVWTKKDLLKRDTAKRNCLNWIAFFNIPDFEKWLSTKIVF